MGMDPHTGDYVSSTEWDNLSPAERERYSVRLEATEEDVRAISDAIKELRALKPEAKKLSRSGNPAARAEGRAFLTEFEELVRHAQQ